MSRPRLISLFSGYGGLDMALQEAFNADTVAVADIDPGACRILAHHHPDVPNLGDVSTVDWSGWSADIVAGGFPCQDVSHAGRRAGLIRDGDGRTRSGLWGQMLRAINELRPQLVVAENVRGLLSATADSDVEPCPWCMGDADSEPHMRALGAVLADLAELGFDANWYGLRAADVGAAHGRFRVFVFAWPTGAPADPDWIGYGGSGVAGRSGVSEAADDLTLLLTPRTSDTNGAGVHGAGGLDLRTAVTLLPTPNPFHMGNTEEPDAWRERRADVFKRTGTRHGPALPVVARSIADGKPLTPDNYMPDED